MLIRIVCALTRFLAPGLEQLGPQHRNGRRDTPVPLKLSSK